MSFSAVSFDDAAKSRIKEAADFERRIRIESFLGVASSFGVFKVRPIQIRDVLELDYVDNRLTNGGYPELDDYVHFLWMLKTDSEKRSEKKFAKWAALNLNESIKEEIKLFISSQFNDIPASTTATANEFDSSTPLVSLIDALCSEYGWELDAVMHTPLEAALQLFQQIIHRNDSKTPIRNRITQQARAEEMKKLRTAHG